MRDGLSLPSRYRLRGVPKRNFVGKVSVARQDFVELLAIFACAVIALLR